MKKIILLLTVLMILIQLASAGSPAVVSVMVPTQRINVGDTFNISINIDPKGNYTSGAQTNLIFNSSVIRVNSVSEGNYFGQYGAKTYFFITQIDNTSGAVYNIVDLILGAYNVSTPGTFATVSLTAINSGYTNLNLTHVIIASPDSQQVPLSIVNQSLSLYNISDVNGDFVTNILDITLVSQHFGEATTYPYPAYDVNRDGTVDVLDLTYVSKRMGI